MRICVRVYRTIFLGITGIATCCYWKSSSHPAIYQSTQQSIASLQQSTQFSIASLRHIASLHQFTISTQESIVFLHQSNEMTRNSLLELQISVCEHIQQRAEASEHSSPILSSANDPLPPSYQQEASSQSQVPTFQSTPLAASPTCLWSTTKYVRKLWQKVKG